MKKIVFLIGILFLLPVQWAAGFTEPTMADYTAFPINTTQSVQPNIMVILDNSGSMNFNAYGTYPGDYGTVSDMPFTGEPYSQERTFQISSGQDDAEEYSGANQTLYYNDWDLDLGSFTESSNNAIAGLRFQNVSIPKGAVIQSAYIEFTANDYHDVATNILIEGEASDDAAPFATEPDNLKSRVPTTATVKWENLPAWNGGVAYPTADISPIVQELVDRDGWVGGNAMVFRFTGLDTGPNKRDARPYDANASTAPKLHVVFSGPTAGTRYYGYFNPNFFYTFGSTFTLKYKKVAFNYGANTWSVSTLDGTSTVTLDSAAIVSEKLWDGNWLNWLCMRRVDVLRKVLMGGLATARTGGGNQINYGETPAQSSRVFSKRFDSSFGTAVSPFNGNYTFRMEGGRIYVVGTSYYYNIRIQKNSSYEPEEFVDGNLAGILQKVGDKARWGNIWFNSGTDKGGSGGTVEHTIGTNLTTMVTDLQNTSMDTWTPLAEAFYVAMQYFKQEDPQNGLDYPNSAVPNDNLGDDPYHNGKEYVPCAKSFVILLTDGASTKDAMIPEAYKDYDGDSKEVACDEFTCNYPNGGSDYLDDLALYARTVDLRSDLDGDQNMILYAIHAFDKDPNASSLLRDAARNGGFEDRDGDLVPDGDYTSPAEDRLEWDKDSDGEPDTFFEASDGYELEARLLSAITDIMKRASSGTTASVLATNNLGAGNSVQSYYRPLVTDGLEEARWLGYLQSLWLDPWGNLREDSNGNLQLDLRSSGATNIADDNVDRIVQMVNTGSDTVLRRFTSHYLYNSDNGSLGECGVANCEPVYEEVTLNSLIPLFEAGTRLSQKAPDTRKIFTYIGESGVVPVGEDMFDTGGDVVLFDTGVSSRLKPFLGVNNNTVWGDSGAGLGVDADTRTSNIIEWTRGTDLTGLRNRTLAGVTWRLGDIVNSTPLVVGEAREHYHSLYSDEEYIDFIKYAKNRETIIYVGANDGMLHAFTNYIYKQMEDENQTPYYAKPDGTTEPIGEELWAYIPQSVLPHLKWDASVDYTHTFYVNSEPRVFDAKILPDDMYYTDDDANPNYGTFMVFGLNMGGKDISVYEDFGSGSTERAFSPTYVLMDITDPRKPRLIWEKSYTGLGFSTSVPAPVRVGSLDGNDSKWFLVFGSGATDYDHATSNLEQGRIFVVDLLTGEPYGQSPTEEWLWTTPNKAYFNAPLALDMFQSNNVDAIYLAENYYSISGGEWRANVYKISIPCSPCAWDSESGGGTVNGPGDYKYTADPSSWSLEPFFESPGPVTAKLNTAADTLENNLLYFGTGKYISNDDKSDQNEQFLFCVKDPFYNEKYEGSYYHNFGSTLVMSMADLMDSSGIVVNTSGTVSGYSGVTEFWDFVDAVRKNEDGWYLPLIADGTNPSERIISQTAIFGGIFLTPTFSPSEEICAMGGNTGFLGGYYETGTGYIRPVFSKWEAGDGDIDVSTRNAKTYLGMPPSKLVIHVGQERGTTVTIQLGTGEFLTFYGRSAISNENAIMEIYDDPTQAPQKNPACSWENF